MNHFQIPGKTSWIPFKLWLRFLMCDKLSKSGPGVVFTATLCHDTSNMFELQKFYLQYGQNMEMVNQIWIHWKLGLNNNSKLGLTRTILQTHIVIYIALCYSFKYLTIITKVTIAAHLQGWLMFSITHYVILRTATINAHMPCLHPVQPTWLLGGI